MVLVRHGLMVVGMPFSGKTSAIKVIDNAIYLCFFQLFFKYFIKLNFILNII